MRLEMQPLVAVAFLAHYIGFPPGGPCLASNLEKRGIM
jgi:hypothetical protein